MSYDYKYIDAVAETDRYNAEKVVPVDYALIKHQVYQAIEAGETPDIPGASPELVSRYVTEKMTETERVVLRKSLDGKDTKDEVAFLSDSAALADSLIIVEVAVEAVEEVAVEKPGIA